ncbi:MAG: ABC transporter ATP-binding protein [Proteobacteria bacterium]|nr:ABC transporter ATP-binding protein [Pseudomonadota bacterium]
MPLPTAAQTNAASPIATRPAAAERPAVVTPLKRNAGIEIKGLVKRFETATLYDGFDLTLPGEKITAVFGPNGCGKSTLINMIAGILPYDGGSILIDGKPIKSTRVAYVFQNYREAMFPWLRAVDNIRYPLKYQKLDPAEGERRLGKLLADFDVRFDINRYPYQLSGGQQQLVSIMRALIVQPEVLFLDEPFSALDYELTLMMRDQLQRVIVEREITTLLVSHDLDEAIYLSDHLLMLTRQPARIADFVAIDLPRPRRVATLSDDGFVALKAHCLSVFEREVRRGGGGQL